jgi:ABC-2 type transport system permease protein
VFEAMRTVVGGGRASGAQLAVGGALAAGYVLLAAWGFARVHRYAVRTGLIARYSAETVN